MPQIAFSRRTAFLGRNGVCYMDGVDITALRYTICVTPITSRKQRGRAWLEVPVEQAEEVARLLLEAASIIQADREEKECTTCNVKLSVSWEIDLDAATPREAAEEALRIMQRPDTMATVFDVTDPAGNTHRVDLMEGEEDERSPPYQ